MTPEQTANLTNLIMLKRNELGLSVNEVGRLAEIEPSTMWRIEQGLVANPRIESLIAIANVLGVNTFELFTTIGWLTADELPSLSAYLDGKYPNLPEAVSRHIEHHVTKILHAYSHSAGDRHNTADLETCPWCTNHTAQQPTSSEEHPHGH